MPVFVTSPPDKACSLSDVRDVASAHITAARGRAPLHPACAHCTWGPCANTWGPWASVARIQTHARNAHAYTSTRRIRAAASGVASTADTYDIRIQAEGHSKRGASISSWCGPRPHTWLDKKLARQATRQPDPAPRRVTAQRAAAAAPPPPPAACDARAQAARCRHDGANTVRARARRCVACALFSSQRAPGSAARCWGSARPCACTWCACCTC